MKISVYRLKALEKEEEVPEEYIYLKQLLKRRREPKPSSNSWRRRFPQAEEIILRHLFDNSNRFVSSEELITNVWWGLEEPDFALNLIRLYVLKLRRRLKPEFHIITYRRNGYKLVYSSKRIDKGRHSRKTPAKKRSPVAASLSEKQFQPKKVPSKKKYNRVKDDLKGYLKDCLRP
jgi:DNA-binding winged helix-turn-helix (wHTH) protein